MKSLGIFMLTLCFCLQLSAAENPDPLQRVIHLPKQKCTIYEWLNQISDLSGYNFIYDSKLVDNERKLKLQEGDYTLRDIIYKVLGNNDLVLKIVEHYIVIDTKEANPQPLPPPDVRQREDTLHYITVSGALYDKVDKTPIPDCAITIEGAGIGTVANSNGLFALKIPYTLRTAQLNISHLGYETQHLPIMLFSENVRNIYLTQRIFPIPEVIVRMVNPRKIVEEVMQFRSRNYPIKPSYLTVFYREGVEKRKVLLSLSEAVFKVYKSSYDDPPSNDQMKMLKMRKITNQSLRDTFILKMKAGPEATLLVTTHPLVSKLVILGISSIALHKRV